MRLNKKSLGQNFLIDKNIIKKIINLTCIKNRHIIEIGPGEGALTNEILKHKPKSLSIIEKDTGLAKKLELKFYNIKIIKVYNADILKFNLENIIKKNSVIMGNLPYNISSQILVKILKFSKWFPNFSDLILMFQKELGEKVIGKYLSPNYGRLSILSSYRLILLKKFLVSANCFSPKPKVTSMVLHFQPTKNKFYKIKNISNLEKITNILFSNKRKMINKNLKKILTKNEISKINDLKLNYRPSETQPNLYYKITEFYEKK
jgi:16S rRNA (adenine1518-N6/adenine1519-N6)-dimethyltransferase